jgi:hypothetical protein
MSHSPGNYRCPLGRLQPQTTDLEEVKRSGWHEQQILVVSPKDERLDWVEREIVQRIGERLYGRRGGRRVGS